MKQLAQTLRDAGFGVIVCEDSIIVGNQTDEPITLSEVLEAIYPQFRGDDYIIKVGFVCTITERNDKYRQMQKWWQQLSPEEKWQQILYRWEDVHRDQQQALEWSRGDE